MSIVRSTILLALLAPLVLSYYDPNISNGSCYYASGQQLDKSFFPCGNADGGTLPCCEAGDHCLSSLACYDPDHGTTYLAGCSDESYLDMLCPNKGGYSDRPWTGMIDCPDDSANWILCDDGYGTTITNGALCTCSSQSTAFTDAPTLTSILFLPAEKGDHVTWVTYDGELFNGNTDLTTTFGAGYYSSIAGRDEAPSLTPVSSEPSAASGSISVLTSRPPTTSSTSTSKSVPTAHITPAVNNSTAAGNASKLGEKVGIGIGAAGGACVLGLLLWLMFFCNRRRRRSRQQAVSEVEKLSPHSPSETNQNSPEISDPRSPAFSGHKSELSADFDATATSLIPGQHAHTISSVTGGSSARTSRFNSAGFERPAGVSELAGDHNHKRRQEETWKTRNGTDREVYEMPA